jgi:DedD protein
LNTRYENERELQDLHEPEEQDREISLGTTTILGIFFTLALLCAVFFGFGYSMGRRSAQPVVTSTEITTGSENSNSKPSPANTANQAATAFPAGKQSAGTAQTAIVPLDSPAAAAEDTQQMPDPGPPREASPNPRTQEPVETVTRSTSKPAAMVPVVAAAPVTGSSIVQVAAMSHQEDADVVAADLKRRGYTVAIRREPQDKLFHVQIGPFSTKKEADAMRQRLQGDGYNSAILK